MMKYFTEKKAILFLIIFYSVGLLGFSIHQTRELFKQLVFLNLIISASVLFLFHRDWSLKNILLFAGIALTGFLVELAGVNTQVIFGIYTYGGNLGPGIAETPLLIGLNWLFLIYCIFIIFNKINTKWYFPPLGSLVMVFFDFVMEPVAMKIGMWQWDNNHVPAKNYLSWFLVSLVLFYFLVFFRAEFRNPVAWWLLLIQFCFFLFLNGLISIL